MLKEAHTISYIQQTSHEWIEGDEEKTTHAQAIASLRVVPTNIQHRPEVLQRFKVAHEPLVKALSSFENMENHGKPIKPILHQLITWTLPKERITLLELFGGISTGLETLLQAGMVVGRYFYVDIDPIARQVAASRMMDDALPSPGLNPLEGPTMLSCGKLGLGRRSRLLALERGRGAC
jgi:hypothetical protein